MLDVLDITIKSQPENVLYAGLLDADIGDMPDTPVRASPAGDEDDLVRLVWNPARGKAVTNDRFVAMDPMPEFSEGTGPQRNLIIEGDNWDALRWLRMTHRGKVRCILIDPPYNTGSTGFAYDDRFEKSTWLGWLKARLEIARDLLTEDGVMLICIDDARRSHLELLMEQVMPGRRAGSIVWRSRQGGNDVRGAYLSTDHEHVLVWANPGFHFGGQEKDYASYSNADNDPRGPWMSSDLSKAHTYLERPGTYYPLLDPASGAFYPCNPDTVWRYSSKARLKPGQKLRTKTMEDFIVDGKILFPKDSRIDTWPTVNALLAAIDSGDVPRSGSGIPLLRRGLPGLEEWVGRPCGWGTPRFKRHQADLKATRQPLSSWVRCASDDDETDIDGSDSFASPFTEEGTKAVKTIFGRKVFDYPKPPTLIRELLRQATGGDGIVLDFFAGSGTTAQAVLELNAEDDGDRSFILASTSEAAHNGGTNLCRDVCAERVRRVINGYSAPTKKDPNRRVVGIGGGFTYMRVRRIAPGCADFGTADGSQWRNANAWVLALTAEGMPVTAAMPEEVADGVWALTARDADDMERTVAFAPAPGPSGLAWLLDATKMGPLSVWTECPSAFRGFPAKVAVRDTAREIRARWETGR